MNIQTELTITKFKMQRKYDKIYEELKSSGLRTSGHLIPQIFHSEYVIIKIIFIISWLAGAGFTLYLITASIIDYYNYGVISQTRLIRENQTLFPKITICNNDRFVTNQSITFLANLILKDESFSSNVSKASSNGADTDLKLVNWFIENKIDFESQALFAAYTSDLATQRSLGYDQSTFIQECTFDEDKCSSDMIVPEYDLTLGNCFTFNGNSKSIQKSDASGKQRGLQLELFIGKPYDYLSLEENRGAKIYIYNHSNYFSESESLEISGGFETNIGLIKRISESYIRPYSDCQIYDNQKIALTEGTDTQFIDLFVNSNKKYRSQDCLQLCYQALLVKNCNCIDYLFKFDNLLKIKVPGVCSWVDNSADSDCSKNIDHDTVCGKKCPPQCDTVTFDKTTSFSYLLNSSEGQSLKVNVFFSDISYYWLSETPSTSTIALFSSIGGTLGKYAVDSSKFSAHFILKNYFYLKKGFFLVSVF